jgi:hypothetical protein
MGMMFVRKPEGRNHLPPVTAGAASRHTSPMLWHSRTTGWLIAIVFVTGWPTGTRAQTVGQYAAWDALLVSPIGAFIPLGEGPTANSPTNSVAIRYGRWRYNIDDADHGIYGLTWSHAAGSRSRASITGGYAHVSCDGCEAWAMWGADFESRVLEVDRGEGRHPVTATLAARVSVGGGGLRGPPHSISRTAAFEMPVAVRLRYRTGRDVWASLSPGAAYGNLWGPTSSDGAVLGMLGTVAGCQLTSFLGMELGARKVFITGGPIDFGASLVWAFH